MTNSDNPQPSAFDLLHPAVQRRLWEMQWDSLRPLQVAGIREILSTSQHVILAAPTAAGKTEAAFLPILSAIAEHPKGSVRAVYVGPLKALINDQFSRIATRAHLDMPVHSWHGDVAANKKAKLVADPGGILLITPESIESLFVNRSNHLAAMFSRLQFIVIDELHSFLDDERGLHLRSLLTRLLAKTMEPAAVRMIGLSATIGDMMVAKRFLAPDALETVTVVEDHSDGKELKLRVHCYVTPATPPELEQGEGDPSDDAIEVIADDVVKHCRGSSNLIFTNSRADAELFADACRQRGQSMGLPDQFLIHHGSLSADIRREAEATMKSGVIATTFSTPTLELGIDIGAVRMVGQIDPPWSISSLKQRLGRSGRRPGESQILRMYLRENQITPGDDFFDALHLDLLRAVASTELLLSGWIEPPHPPSCDLGTLTHQIISAIGEAGGRTAMNLYQLLCVNGPFRDVDRPLYTRLLRQLATREIIAQMPEGDLILGIVGERVYRHFTFYAVFQTPENFTLIYGSERLGTLDVVPETGQLVLFAARRWLVTDVDPERKEIHVEPARGRKRTRFGGRGGMLHPHIIETMRQLLLSSDIPIYLDLTGRSLLEQARRTAAEAAIAARTVIPLGPKRSCILTWGGTRIHRTLAAMMITLDIHPSDCLIGLVLPMAASQVPHLVAELLHKTFNVEHLALAVQDALPTGKYNWALGPELLAVRHSRQYIDVAYAKRVLFTTAI